MRRIFLGMAGFFVLLWPFWGCSLDGTEPAAPDSVSKTEPETKSEKAVFGTYKVISETEIDFEFSSPVKVSFLSFNPNLKIDSIKNGSTVKVYLKESLEPEMMISAGLFAEDQWKNEVSMLVSLEIPADLDPSDSDSDPADSDPTNSDPADIDPADSKPPAFDPADQKPEASRFRACKVISETEVEFEFTSPVTVTSLSFDPPLDHEYTEEENTIKVLFEKSFEPGQRITADIEAEDEEGNEITTQIPFFAKNLRVPELWINELRTECSKPKGEFIELKMRSSGNLGGLEIFTTGTKKNTMIYRFPPVEVKEGEFVVLHLRTYESLCIDETGAALDESGGTDSGPTSRDFWLPESREYLRKKDAVYIQDQNKKILDAVMISDVSAPSWDDKAYNDLEKTAGILFDQRAWKSASGKSGMPEDAVNISEIKTSKTDKSISRNENHEDTDTAADWQISAEATPGMSNS